ncbi:MAG: hypothetical protein AAB784_01905 [Patescibacteria group bacterium]
MSIFEIFSAKPKMPKTEILEDRLKREGSERMKLMEERREKAEKESIEQAQNDLQNLPKQIDALGLQIKQLKDNARSNRELAYGEQFKPAGVGNRGFYEQQAVAQDLKVEATEKEKLLLEVKLYSARKLLESRGLLEK